MEVLFLQIGDYQPGKWGPTVLLQEWIQLNNINTWANKIYVYVYNMASGFTPM